MQSPIKTRIYKLHLYINSRFNEFSTMEKKGERRNGPEILNSKVKRKAKSQSHTRHRKYQEAQLR